MRLITEANLDDIALGAAVLGTGGGGNPYIGKLLARSWIQRFGPVTLLSPDELDDDALVIPSGKMGAPTVSVEKLPGGSEFVTAFRAIQEYLGREAFATMSTEVGGVNSVTPFMVAAELGIPLVDADMMGRAFPEIQMATPSLFGVSATPMAIADEKGNSSIINTTSNHWTETFARGITINMGCTAMIALYPMTGKEVKVSAVGGTLTRAEMIGSAITKAHHEKTDPIEAVRAATNGYVIWTGKVSDIQRRTQTGFARGEASIQGVGEHESETLRISFQNEFLIAQTDTDVLATTPDLITILDAETGVAITTEMLRYGFRVAVLAMPCDSRWRTPRGLEVVGPGYFGYDTEFIPVEERYG
jgi:uncharacterized protein